MWETYQSAHPLEEVDLMSPFPDAVWLPGIGNELDPRAVVIHRPVKDGCLANRYSGITLAMENHDGLRADRPYEIGLVPRPPRGLGRV